MFCGSLVNQNSFSHFCNYIQILLDDSDGIGVIVEVHSLMNKRISEWNQMGTQEIFSTAEKL